MSYWESEIEGWLSGFFSFRHFPNAFNVSLRNSLSSLKFPSCMTATGLWWIVQLQPITFTSSDGRSCCHSESRWGYLNALDYSREISPQTRSGLCIWHTAEKSDCCWKTLTEHRLKLPVWWKEAQLWFTMALKLDFQLCFHLAVQIFRWACQGISDVVNTL